LFSSGINMIDPALFAELRDLCLRSFPERLEQRLAQVEPIATGRKPGRAFTLSWREGARPRVERLLLRRYADDWTWWSFQDGQKAQREWTVMRWLYGEGLPLPKVYARSTTDADPFLLLERPSGQTLISGRDGQETTDHVSGGQAYQSKDTLGRRLCVEALAVLLARLHRSTVPDSVREVLPRVVLDQELERVAHIAQRCGDRALMETVRELIQEQVEALPPCVLHGDPQLSSLQYDARGITAWLDWENSALGDPRWDVACVVNELQVDQAPPLADRFCEIYADRTGLQLHDMFYWQALTATHRWATHKWALQAGSAQVPTTDTQDELPLSMRIERHREQAQWALIRLQDIRKETTNV
jgi:aminoglycoside phosphotransferase (APT) family kinase protein